jgi:hypothetical protein
MYTARRVNQISRMKSDAQNVPVVFEREHKVSVVRVALVHVTPPESSAAVDVNHQRIFAGVINIEALKNEGSDTCPNISGLLHVRFRRILHGHDEGKQRL